MRIPLLASLVLSFASTADAQEPFVTAHARLGGAELSAAHRGGRSVAPAASWSTPRASLTRRVWAPGRYETTRRRVWVPGAWERVRVEPVYRWVVDECGQRRRVLVRPACTRRVWTPGHYELRDVRVWRPAGWRTVSYGR